MIIFSLRTLRQETNDIRLHLSHFNDLIGSHLSLEEKHAGHILIISLQMSASLALFNRILSVSMQNRIIAP